MISSNRKKKDLIYFIELQNRYYFRYYNSHLGPHLKKASQTIYFNNNNEKIVLKIAKNKV